MQYKPFVFALCLNVCLQAPVTRAEIKETPTPSASHDRLYAEAIQLMNQGDMEGSLKKTDELLILQPDSSAALNLRGAVMVRKKNFDGAEASFARLLEKDAKNPIALFNLGEVNFLRQNYPKAKGHFTQFLQQPGNEQNALGRYKVYLCDLLGADRDDAQKTLTSLQATISNPFYYYAHAAMEFQQGRSDKGKEYIKSAFDIYPGSMNAAFADSLVQLGWVKQEEVASAGTIDASALNSMDKDFQPERATTPAPVLGFENVLPDFARGEEKKKETSKPAKP